MTISRVLSVSALALAAVLYFQGSASAQRENPFAEPSKLPLQAPPFDQIKDSDYSPAFEEGIRQSLAETAKIASSKAKPSFANTIEAMEKTGFMLQRVSRAFNAVTGANTNDTLQK